MKKKCFVYKNGGFKETKDCPKGVIEIKYIDATPDGNYALRILKCYLQESNTYISDNFDGEPINIMFKLMNESQDKRRAELEKAIEILENTNQEQEAR